MKTTWRKKIQEEMLEQHETWDSVMACTLTPEELDKDFDDGYGGPEGKPFSVWTRRGRVYFPVCYDGAEWVASVPRFPSKESVEHVGGW